MLADYRRKELAYAKFNGSELQIVGSPVPIDDHPDNLSRSPEGHLTVATQRNALMALLHLALGDWVPVASKAYRVKMKDGALEVTAADQPMPKGSAAVSTAIETEGWWYFSQISRPAVYACRKAGRSEPRTSE